ncbi:hypothetical protein D3C77_414990 [compost metagenome]
MRGDAGPRQALGAFVHEATDELPFVAKLGLVVAGLSDPGILGVEGTGNAR